MFWCLCLLILSFVSFLVSFNCLIYFLVIAGLWKMLRLYWPNQTLWLALQFTLPCGTQWSGTDNPLWGQPSGWVVFPIRPFMLLAYFPLLCSATPLLDPGCLVTNSAQVMSLSEKYFVFLLQINPIYLFFTDKIYYFSRV